MSLGIVVAVVIVALASAALALEVMYYQIDFKQVDFQPESSALREKIACIAQQPTRKYWSYSRIYDEAIKELALKKE